MTFFAEQRIAKLRPRGGKLFVPTAILGLDAAVFAFLANRFSEQWQLITEYAILGAVAFLFWLVPVLRYLSTYLEVTTSRVIYRSGLMGQKRFEVSLGQIAQVELAKGRAFTIFTKDGRTETVVDMPKAKMIAVEIDRLAASI
ncbi:MAG: hypothetical protein RL716_561 [Actinomycetota bacterium]|jgi:membrane protein YdbS with pleckstrin-like domain